MRLYLKPCLALLVVVSGMAGTVQPLRAQALGDVAQKEEERRKEIKAPAKVYTNKDLGLVPGPPPGTVSSASREAPAETGKDAAKASDDKDKDKAKNTPQRDQAYWGGRKKELQAKLESDQALAEAQQSRIKALTADFAVRADPTQRSSIERDRVKALAELERLRKSVLDGKKALSDLDDDARKAAVPPGWLR